MKETNEMDKIKKTKDEHTNEKDELQLFINKTLMHLLICKGGCNINERNSSGETPIHFSSYFGFLDNVKLFIKYGAYVWIVNK